MEDVPCESACIEQGSPAAQEKFRAFDACLVGSTCETAACVQAECDSQIRACIEDAPPVDPNPNPAQPRALSQQDLVGTWESIEPSEGKATSFTFNAGGTYRKVYVYTDPSPECLVFKKRTIVDNGTIQVEGDTLNVRPSGTVQTIVSCTDNETGKQTISLDDVFKFSVASDTLTLTNTFTSKVTTFTKK